MGSSAVQIAELISLREKVADPDTRTRVEATHRVWDVGLATADPEIKLTASQSHAGKSTWEPETKRRAEEAVAAIQNSMK